MGWPFLLLGLLSGMLLFLEHPTPKAGVLLALTVWASRRFDSFARYVTRDNIDPRDRFAGVWSRLDPRWQRDSQGLMS